MDNERRADVSSQKTSAHTTPARMAAYIAMPTRLRLRHLKIIKELLRVHLLIQ